jgi:hypothetical protein
LCSPTIHISFHASPVVAAIANHHQNVKTGKKSQQSSFLLSLTICNKGLFPWTSVSSLDYYSTVCAETALG